MSLSGELMPRNRCQFTASLQAEHHNLTYRNSALLYTTYGMLEFGSNRVRSMNKRSLYYPYTTDEARPCFSVDCVILAFRKKKLHVLLHNFFFSEDWQLPGGFMYKKESADEAAFRILHRQTGMSDIYMKQFYLFSDPERKVAKQKSDYPENGKNDTADQKRKSVPNRFISLGYYALVKYDEVKLPVIEHDQSKWFDVDDLPSLHSDHAIIIRTSIDAIRSMLPIVPVGYELLPKAFTIGDLRKVYEIFSGKSLDRRNFLRKVLSSGVLIQLEEINDTNSYNPPTLYTFNKDKMDMLNSFPFI